MGPPEAAPEPAVAEPAADPGISAAAPGRQPRAASAASAAPPTTLRVDPERVDRLINTVGELIINQAMITQRISQLGLARGADIESELEDYKLLARDLQEGVMAIRAQPVKSLFQRMSRIIREVSDSTGKNVRLVTRGEATEVDKTVIERLADPLTHMIRNAVDHGLEMPEKRVAAGKDPEGEIRLSASHKSGSVLIEIADDGAGLNRPKILEIAISKGLVPASAELSEAEIDKLLFLPGFSTASVVSNLSGRGVGMDVVKNSVQALGGRIAISSVPGQGTTFSIVLPLTLAVMDGMVISVAGETMVVPITPILETIRPAANDVQSFGSGGRLLSIRGRYVPIVDVARSLGLRANPDPDQADILILVETENAGQCALRVDAIHDQRQVVIKSVAGNYGTIPGVSAATILGDGKIALILDTDRLAQSDLKPTDVHPDLMPEVEI
jgi:two-component system chemotaxis sensor kinase CheA